MDIIENTGTALEQGELPDLAEVVALLTYLDHRPAETGPMVGLLSLLDESFKARTDIHDYNPEVVARMLRSALLDHLESRL